VNTFFISCKARELEKVPKRTNKEESVTNMIIDHLDPVDHGFVKVYGITYF